MLLQRASFHWFVSLTRFFEQRLVSLARTKNLCQDASLPERHPILWWEQISAFRIDICSLFSEGLFYALTTCLPPRYGRAFGRVQGSPLQTPALEAHGGLVQDYVDWSSQNSTHDKESIATQLFLVSIPTFPRSVIEYVAFLTWDDTRVRKWKRKSRPNKTMSCLLFLSICLLRIR